jgi:hypothetical protein
MLRNNINCINAQHYNKKLGKNENINKKYSENRIIKISLKVKSKILKFL